MLGTAVHLQGTAQQNSQAAELGPLRNQHLPELDGLRGIAILAVLLTHFFSYTMLGRSWTGVARLLMQATLPGWLGVDLFFVLSGFLITGILLNAKSSSHFFRNFYARRALRIMPLYLLVLAVLLFFYAESCPYVLLGVLMLANVAPLFHVGIVSGGQALWSLAVEEHFYLIWPWVVKAFRPAGIALLSGLICVLEPVLRAAARFTVDDVYLYSWFRFDGIAWGALVAILIHMRILDRKNALRLAGLGAALPIAMMLVGAPYGILHRGNRLGAALQFSLFEMLFAAGLLAIVSAPGSRIAAPLRFPALKVCGELSYCLYVTHLILADLVDFTFGRFAALASFAQTFSYIVLRAAVALTLCFLVAIVSRRYFEKPILSFKRYFPQTPDRVQP